MCLCALFIINIALPPSPKNYAADKLFPDGNAVGKQVYLDEDPPTTTIVGVVDRMQEPWVSSDDIEHALFMPIYMPYGNSTRYLVRTEPGRRDEVMKQVEQKLTQANPSRIIGKLRTIEQTRKEAYANDRAMAIILGGVIAALVGSPGPPSALNDGVTITPVAGSP